MLSFSFRQRTANTLASTTLLNGFSVPSRWSDSTGKTYQHMELENRALWNLNWLREWSKGPEQKPVTSGNANSGLEKMPAHPVIGGLLRSLNAFDFQTHLRELGEDRPKITYKELLRYAEDWRVGTTPKENREICDGLIASGTLFQYNEDVYLKVEDLAGLLKSRFPNALMKTREKISLLEKELEPLENEKRKLDLYTEKWKRRVLYGGIILLVAQFGVSLLLVGELSWDCLEPYFYFFYLSNGILFYAFFLWQRQALVLSSICSLVCSIIVQRNHDFDAAKYEKIVKKLRKYKTAVSRQSL